MRIIETQDCLAEGMAHLVRVEPRFADAYAVTGPLPLRRPPDGFAALLRSILGQQVSVASAAGTFARLEAAGATTPHGVLALSQEELRALGLSIQKARYARALAEAGLDYPALRRLPDEEVVAELVAIKGIGRWTAEIYGMFALGRSDMFAPGDLALQEGARMILDLPGRPSPQALSDLALPWSPWRGVAARLLWAYYGTVKRREGQPT